MPNRYLIMLFICLLLLMGCSNRDVDKQEAGPVDCLIHEGPCRKVINEDRVTVVFDVRPRPVVTMKELGFSVELKKLGRPVTNASVMLDLTMPGMFMGVNRPVLAHVGDGRYEGEGVMPVCPHGREIWKAEVDIEREGGRASVDFLFRVK